MALSAGDAMAETGLAGALQVATEEAFGEFPNETARQTTATFNNMLASTIINYFKAHAEIHIKTTDAGLQQYLLLDVLTDTAGPEETKTLTDVLR